jgi:hypothetical protein
MGKYLHLFDYEQKLMPVYMGEQEIVTAFTCASGTYVYYGMEHGGYAWKNGESLLYTEFRNVSVGDLAMSYDLIPFVSIRITAVSTIPNSNPYYNSPWVSYTKKKAIKVTRYNKESGYDQHYFDSTWFNFVGVYDDGGTCMA